MSFVLGGAVDELRDAIASLGQGAGDSPDERMARAQLVLALTALARRLDRLEARFDAEFRRWPVGDRHPYHQPPHRPGWE
jgi:hypothetical protein